MPAADAVLTATYALPSLRAAILFFKVHSRRRGFFRQLIPPSSDPPSYMTIAPISAPAAVAPAGSSKLRPAVTVVSFDPARDAEAFAKTMELAFEQDDIKRAAWPCPRPSLEDRFRASPDRASLDERLPRALTHSGRCANWPPSDRLWRPEQLSLKLRRPRDGPLHGSRRPPAGRLQRLVIAPRSDGDSWRADRGREGG